MTSPLVTVKSFWLGRTDCSHPVCLHQVSSFRGRSLQHKDQFPSDDSFWPEVIKLKQQTSKDFLPPHYCTPPGKVPDVLGVLPGGITPNKKMETRSHTYVWRVCPCPENAPETCATNNSITVVGRRLSTRIRWWRTLQANPATKIQNILYPTPQRLSRTPQQ